MNTIIAKNKLEVAQEFADYFEKAVAVSNQFFVALSGGSTPKVIFDLLASEYATAIDWQKVHFFWGDERCVLPTDDQSNYKMTLDHLLSKISIPSININRVLGENNSKEEALRYGTLLNDKLPIVDGVPQFNLVILGMGDDGHTASIFPHEIDLWNASENCVVANHPESGQQRISLSGKIINNAREVAFLVTGVSKAEKVVEIIGRKGCYENYPASLVVPNSGKLTWYMDKEASSLL